MKRKSSLTAIFISLFALITVVVPAYSQVSLFATKKPLVRIGFTEERRFDAESCETALKLRGFYVDLQVVEDTNVEEKAKGLLFYHRPDDKAVADSIPACLANSNEKLTSTLRRISAGPNPPDFQFVLTMRSVAFKYSTGTTPSTPNEDPEATKRLERLRKQHLRTLAPGMGIAFFVFRNAQDEVWRGKWRTSEIRDAVSGAIVKPAEANWEWFTLPQGRYTLTSFMWGSWSIGPLEFTVTAGTVNKIPIGGKPAFGRVTYESKTVTGEKSNVHVKVWTQETKGGWGWWKGWIDAGSATGELSFDLPPGVYRMGVSADKSINLFTEYFTVQAGKTITIRPINRGRIAVRTGNTPPGVNAGVNTLSKEFAGWLHFDKDDYLDVLAGNYHVANSRFSKRVVVEAGKTSILQP